MKRITLSFFFAFFLLQSFSQSAKSGNTYLKLSGGRVAFGTGDLFGYSLAFDASKNIIKNSRWGLGKLLLGGEMIFENGAANPVVQNTTVEEFRGSTFYQVSNAVLWAKASYYPFKKFARGFNIQLGPTAGYSYRSQEAAASLLADDPNNLVRQSYLSFDNGFTIGYRISTGIEFDITKKLQTGFRLDWCNNNKGEINTLIGLKVGVRL